MQMRRMREPARLRRVDSVLHQVEVFFGQDALIAGHGAEDVAEFGSFGHRHDAEAVHHSFERLGVRSSFLWVDRL